jgi:hypothetical protein
MNERTTFCRAERVLWRVFAGEVLVAVPGRDDIDQLEGPAAAVWYELKSPRTIDEVTESLCKGFASPAELVGPYVKSLLNDLDRRGCVEVSR